MRTKDLRLNAVAGISEGRKLRDKLTALMLNADANPEDAMVYCVVASPDLSGGLDARPVGVTNGPSDLALAKQVMDKLPIGFLVFVLDKADPEEPVFGHMRPLIVEDQRAIKLNQRAFDTTVRAIKRQYGIDERN
jgi:hypothetical protein